MCHTVTMDAPLPHADDHAARPPAAVAIPSPRPRMDWDAWGDGTRSAALPPGARALVTTILPGKAHPVARLPREALTLTPSTLSADDLTALGAVVGDEHVRTDDDARALHLGGKSTPDLLARRSEDPQTAPDAVVAPASHDEVLAVL